MKGKIEKGEDLGKKERRWEGEKREGERNVLSPVGQRVPRIWVVVETSAAL